MVDLSSFDCSKNNMDSGPDPSKKESLPLQVIDCNQELNQDLDNLYTEEPLQYDNSFI